MLPLFQPTPPNQTTNEHQAHQAWRSTQKKLPAGLSHISNLHRGGSIKDLISKFSVLDRDFCAGSLRRARLYKAASIELLDFPGSYSVPATPSSLEEVESPVFKEVESPIPSITVTPPFTESTQTEPGSAQKNTVTSQISARIDGPVGGSTAKTDSKPSNKTQTTHSGNDSVADSGMGSVSTKKSS